MNVLFNEKCRSDLSYWLDQQYSPKLTNAEKIYSNLQCIGHDARREWAESFDIICDALSLYDLVLVHELVVEKVRTNAQCHLILDLSFTMLDDEVFYASFVLDRTLNILRHEKNNENIPPVKANSITPKSMSASCYSLPFFPGLDNSQPEKAEMKNEQDPQGILREIPYGIARA